MVTQISGLPQDSVGFKLTGHITKEDYDNVMLPAVKKVADTSPAINMMMLIDTDLSNFTVGAWMKDALLGIKNLTKFHRVALVADSNLVRSITAVANAIVPGEYRTFAMVEEAAAIAWISGMETTIA
jgi:hypothetical protein